MYGTIHTPRVPESSVLCNSTRLILKKFICISFFFREREWTSSGGGAEGGGERNPNRLHAQCGAQCHNPDIIT